MTERREGSVPSVMDVVAIHGDVVAEYPDTPPGVRDRGPIEFAVGAARGEVGPDPEGIHGRAHHLLRLLTTGHPFVDANKRTALCATAILYHFGGREFDYDHRIREVLAGFATEGPATDGTAAGEQRDRADDGIDSVRAYLVDHTHPLDAEGTPGNAVDPTREGVRRAAQRDRERHRDVYDALADE